MPFSKLQVHETIVKTLKALGYDKPTPVQNKVIPKVLKGNDLRVSAPTGTGKTAAFLLPSITQILNNSSKDKKNSPKVLILAPTRELAMQITTQAKKYSKNLKKMKTIAVYGGVDYRAQNRDLNRPYEILVATPGRLIDYIKRGKISLKAVEVFILDEADRMLDMGFSEDVQYIANTVSKQRQTLLFSATLKGNVLSLSEKLLQDPLEINVKLEIDKEKNIEQNIFYVDDIHHKHKILDHLLKNSEIEQAIVFTATKKEADKISEALQERDYLAQSLHGDMHQRKRSKTVQRLREGKINILVATDVAARGIDVKTISHVINFDLPRSAEDYIHRIGRTARAGKTGVAYSFAVNRERSLVKSIEKLISKNIATQVIEGLEPKKKRSSSNNNKFSQRPRRRRNNNKAYAFQRKRNSSKNRK